MDEKVNQLRLEAAKVMKQLYYLECCPTPEDVEYNPSNSSSGIVKNSKVFANKYKVRALLLGVVTSASNLLHTNDPDATLIWGFFAAKMAVNYIETEEPTSESRRRLLEVINRLDCSTIAERRQFLLHFAGLQQFCYNSLAVVSNPAETRSCLEKAVNVYNEHKDLTGERQAPPCWEGLFGDVTDPRVELVDEVMFEISYTTTLFMLAQAYANDGLRSKSAEYCCETLKRQLHFAPVVERVLNMFGVAHSPPQVSEENADVLLVPPADWLSTSIQKFDNADWATNAAVLSQYYAANGMYENALECLMTARLVVARTDSFGSGDSAYSKLNGTKIFSDISRLSADFSIRLLEGGSKCVLGSKFGLETCTATTGSPKVGHYGSLFGESTNDFLLQAVNDEVRSVGLDAAVSVLSSFPQTYSSAVTLFRWTVRSIKTAMEYYRLDERCSDAVDLIRVHAMAYSYLASFEPNVARKSCMHKRRVDMLENLLALLNPQYYLVICRQIMLDCGDALTTLRDLNESKMQTTFQNKDENDGEVSTEIKRQTAKINAITRQALKMYQRFLDSFRKPSNKQPPDSYDDDWLKHVLMTRFYSARLYTKLISGSQTSRAIELNRALKEYQAMVSIAEAHSGTSVSMLAEVEIAREMVKLMPAQIARVMQQKD